MTYAIAKSFARRAGFTLLTLSLALPIMTETGFAARGVGANGAGSASGPTGGGSNACAGGLCGASDVGPPRHPVAFVRRGDHCFRWLPVYDEDGFIIDNGSRAECW